jgi:hypothetical protein
MNRPFALSLFLVPLLALAADSDSESLATVQAHKYISCRFPISTYIDWGGETPSIRTRADQRTALIGPINWKDRTATFLSAYPIVGTTRILIGDKTVTFSGQSEGGTVWFTTLFYTRPSPATSKDEKVYYSVQSQHDPGNLSVAPIPEQYYGTCTLDSTSSEAAL